MNYLLAGIALVLYLIVSHLSYMDCINYGIC